MIRALSYIYIYNTVVLSTIWRIIALTQTPRPSTRMTLTSHLLTKHHLIPTRPLFHLTRQHLRLIRQRLLQTWQHRLSIQQQHRSNQRLQDLPRPLQLSIPRRTEALTINMFPSSSHHPLRGLLPAMLHPLETPTHHQTTARTTAISHLRSR